jgi:hypothetical protein
MNTVIHLLTDTLALASSSLETGQINGAAKSDKALFNVWVTDEFGNRSIARKNVSASLAKALESSANHGARIRGLSHFYDVKPAE